MRTLVALFLFMGLSILPCNAQLDQYKYFIVPKRFDIFKETNQYQSSTLVKYLMTKYGYEALYDDAIPEELFLNKCRGATLQLAENSSFLLTRVSVVFLDCKGREVYRTPEGSSKSKDYKEAFAESIQEAMDVMAILKYEYVGEDSGQVTAPETPTEPFVTEKEETEKDSAEELLIASSEVIEEAATEAPETIESEIDKVREPLSWTEAVNQNGFILNHLETGETWVLMRTSDPVVFLAYSQNKQGIGFKQSNGWKLEYYLGDERQELMIRTRDQ